LHGAGWEAQRVEKKRKICYNYSTYENYRSAQSTIKTGGDEGMSKSMQKARRLQIRQELKRRIKRAKLQTKQGTEMKPAANQ